MNIEYKNEILNELTKKTKKSVNWKLTERHTEIEKLNKIIEKMALLNEETQVQCF